MVNDNMEFTILKQRVKNLEEKIIKFENFIRKTCPHKMRYWKTEGNRMTCELCGILIKEEDDGG